MSATKSIYDYPEYYDLVYGSDWKAEFDFLVACMDEYVQIPMERIFEPACGTGRLLFRFGRLGLDVSGLDLNESSIEYCNHRLKQHGLEPSAFVGDMCDFRLDEPSQVMFNMINSFRHLTSEEQATDHLTCVRDSLDTGGIYVLGLHLMPLKGEVTESETWSATEGDLTINSSLWLVDRNFDGRYEDYGMSFEVLRGSDKSKIEDVVRFRTYTAKQFTDLVDKIDGLDILAIHDFTYEIDEPIKLDESVEDVVFLLQKTV